MSESRKRSKWWYLVPVIFSIIGGLIAHFALKKDDPKLAKNCFIVGILVFVGQMIYNVFVALSFLDMLK